MLKKQPEIKPTKAITKGPVTAITVVARNPPRNHARNLEKIAELNDEVEDCKIRENYLIGKHFDQIAAYKSIIATLQEELATTNNKMKEAQKKINVLNSLNNSLLDEVKKRKEIEASRKVVLPPLIPVPNVPEFQEF